jgi:hypothetical protein
MFGCLSFYWSSVCIAIFIYDFFPPHLVYRECDHHEMCKTSLQVLSMILKDKNNHDVSAIFNKILSANPRKVLEAFIGEIHRPWESNW